MTEQEFLSQQGPYFHTKLMMYHENLVKDEHKPSNDTILHFEFPEGEYTISYEDLKIKADEETLEFLEANGLELKTGPIAKNEGGVTPKIINIPSKPGQQNNGND